MMYMDKAISQNFNKKCQAVAKLQQELPVRKQIRPRPSGFELN